MPADNKRKGFNTAGRLTGLDLARIKQLIKQTAVGGSTVVVTVITGTLTGTVSINAVGIGKTVDLTTTYALISTKGDANIDDIACTVEIVSATLIHVKRNGTTGNTNWVVHVIENIPA